MVLGVLIGLVIGLLAGIALGAAWHMARLNRTVGAA